LKKSLPSWLYSFVLKENQVFIAFNICKSIFFKIYFNIFFFINAVYNRFDCSFAPLAKHRIIKS
jgi:hypothetical protein